MTLKTILCGAGIFLGGLPLRQRQNKTLKIFSKTKTLCGQPFYPVFGIKGWPQCLI
jgi:hypothetical protein